MERVIRSWQPQVTIQLSPSMYSRVEVLVCTVAHRVPTILTGRIRLRSSPGCLGGSRENHHLSHQPPARGAQELLHQTP
jgi:hypothetical protein